MYNLGTTTAVIKFCVVLYLHTTRMTRYNIIKYKYNIIYALTKPHAHQICVRVRCFFFFFFPKIKNIDHVTSTDTCSHVRACECVWVFVRFLNVWGRFFAQTVIRTRKFSRVDRVVVCHTYVIARSRRSEVICISSPDHGMNTILTTIRVYVCAPYDDAGLGKVNLGKSVRKLTRKIKKKILLLQ